jgi:two-component system sensor histidine kinase KdpD
MEALRATCDLLAAALGNARLFQEEQEMVKRLQDLDRMKTNFLGSVSHELRTNVTAIVGFADLLSSQLGKLSPERQADFLERIGRNARSLGVLVDDLLDSSRLARSGMSVSLQPVDLSTLVPRVIDQMSSILADHPVFGTIAPGVVAVADPAAVERIVVNLLSNAAKYTPPQTVVNVSLEREASNAVLCVSDRGPGIAPQERQRIFDLFYRVDNPATRASRGVGIGLALVRQLVDLLQGTVGVDETPGGGARFRLTLPVYDGDRPGAEPTGEAQVLPTT